MVRATLLYSDIVLALLVWWVAVALRDLLIGSPPSGATATVVVPGMLAWLGLRALAGLYPGHGLSRVEELRLQTYALLAAAGGSVVFAFFLQVGGLVSRLTLVLGFAGLLVFGPLTRQFVKWVLRRAELWGKPVVILSSDEAGARLVEVLEEEWGMGLRPVVLFEGPGDRSLAGAVGLSRKHGLDTVMFAMPSSGREDLGRLINLASYTFRHVTVIPDLSGVVNSAVAVRDFSGTFGVEIKHNLLDPSVRRVKRALDLLATASTGLFVLPVLAVLALLVWLDAGRPIFYGDRRMGKDGRAFPCLKFRTMLPDAEAVLQKMLEEDPELREEYGKYHKLQRDPRVTATGRLLRKTSLDELPQLWNVLRGEMSLVGPRPYLVRESAEIGIAQGEILRVPPGITGLWQVRRRSSTSFSDRVGLDTYYVRNWSIWMDLVILARTVQALLSDRSAH